MDSKPKELRLSADTINRQYWIDLLRFRNLAWTLAWRDINVMYKQTVIGLLWAIIRPVLTVSIFTIIFGRLAAFSASDSTPYVLIVLAGAIPWLFFATALGHASNSVVDNAAIITKIYFPRILIPLASCAVALVEFTVCCLLLAGVLVYLQHPVGLSILLLPLLMLLILMNALGPGLLFAALNVRYRDFRYAIPFVLQIGIFLSPVGFPSGLVAEKLGTFIAMLYALNPLVGTIDLFRWAIIGTPLSSLTVMISLGSSTFFFFLGVTYFRMTETRFADVI